MCLMKLLLLRWNLHPNLRSAAALFCNFSPPISCTAVISPLPNPLAFRQFSPSQTFFFFLFFLAQPGDDRVPLQFYHSTSLLKQSNTHALYELINPHSPFFHVSVFFLPIANFKLYFFFLLWFSWTAMQWYPRHACTTRTSALAVNGLSTQRM
jgi:hypothetical protein